MLLLFHFGCKTKQEAPSVRFVSPQDGQKVSGKVLVKLEVKSEKDVKKVEIFIDEVTTATFQSPSYQYQSGMIGVESRTQASVVSGEDRIGTAKIIALVGNAAGDREDFGEAGGTTDRTGGLGRGADRVSSDE